MCQILFSAVFFISNYYFKAIQRIKFYLNLLTFVVINFYRFLKQFKVRYKAHAMRRIYMRKASKWVKIKMFTRILKDLFKCVPHSMECANFFMIFYA